MSQQSDQKLNEFSIQLLPVDESRFEKKPIQQIPTTRCGLLWYKSVAVPVFSTCIIVAVVLTASILILQNCTSTFKPSWMEWHYMNDFQLSQVYTTKNGTRIDYTNRSELNDTIFNPDNQKGIKMYDYFQAIVQLNTEDTLDEIKLTLNVEATNESFSEDLAVSTTTEFYTHNVYNGGDWYKLDTIYNVSSGGQLITILSKPSSTACNFWSGDSCYISDKYRIKIRNQIKSVQFYDVMSLTLKSHKHNLYKIGSVVFCTIFSLLSVFNVLQWMKICQESKFKIFKAKQASKFRILLFTTIITIYWAVITAVGIVADTKWFKDSKYYSIRVIATTFSFYLCFVAFLMSVTDFIKISWAFLSTSQQSYFDHTKWVSKLIIRFGMVTYPILLIVSFVNIVFADLTSYVNGATYILSWVITCFLFVYGFALVWTYMKIYVYIMINDTEKIFDPKLFNDQQRVLVRKYILNLYTLELFILMVYGSYSSMEINYRDEDKYLCYYLSVVVVYCVMNSYFYHIIFKIPRKCEKCGFEEEILKPRKNNLCKICSGYEPRQSVNMNRSESDLQKLSNANLSTSSIKMKSINSVEIDNEEKKSTEIKVVPQVLPLFKASELQNASENCQQNCHRLQRIKYLCNVFRSEQEFMYMFERLYPYTLTQLINDYVHVMEIHKLKQITEYVGLCESENECPILQSRLRNMDITKPLLIQTIKQIHCYLYHNAYQMAEIRKKRFSDNSMPGAININSTEQLEAKEEIKEEESEPILATCMICGNVLLRNPANNNASSCSLCHQSCGKNQFVYVCKNVVRHSQQFTLCQQCAAVQSNIQRFKQQQEQKHEEYQQYKYNDYGFGSFVYYDLLKEHFGTLKQELLNNEHRIDITKWNNIFNKAQKYMDPKNEAAQRFVDRKSGHPFCIQHLISIICYTDCDELCHHFTESFRKMDGEHDKDVLDRHCTNFYHFGKWLNDTISNYGELASEFADKCSLYRGLNGQFLFQSLCTDFNIPTSTTTEISVAQNFTANNGIIIQLNTKWRYGSTWDRATCLPVHWISFAGVEKEVLFFGNFNQLRIVNIVFISSNDDTMDNLRLYLRAIYLWEIICDGYSGDSDANVDYDKLTYQILNVLIFSKLNPDKEILISSDYILRLFDNICNKRKRYSLQGIWNMYWKYDEAPNRNELSEMSNLLDSLMENVTEEEIFDALKCKCDLPSKMIKKVIVKKDWCDGCRNICNSKNKLGFHCQYSHCNYCLHTSCAKTVVKMQRLLPNAVHQHAKINRFDEIKANALKIELLKSAGLW